MHVTKLDAAKRQLETAFHLYFLEKDPVSVHSLASAALGLPEDLDRGTGGRGSLMERMVTEVVRSEHQAEVRSLFREPQNFFKHADRDPEATLNFDPLLTEMIMLAAGYKYRELSGETLGIAYLAQVWLIISRPAWFNLPEDMRQVYERVRGLYAPHERSRFYHEVYSYFAVGVWKAKK